MSDSNLRPRTRVVLHKVRLAYAEGLITARAFQPGQPEKFGGTFLMPPQHEGPALIEEALEAAAEQRWGKRKDWPKRLRGLAADPVIKLVTDYEKIGIPDPKDWTFVRANSVDPPGIVDHAVRELSRADYRREVYSGRWATVSVNAFAYEQQTGAGVALGLGNIQLLNHDGRLGTARPRAREESDPTELPDEDLDDDDDDGGDDLDDDPVEATPPPRRR